DGANAVLRGETFEVGAGGLGAAVDAAGHDGVEVAAEGNAPGLSAEDGQGQHRAENDEGFGSKASLGTATHHQGFGLGDAACCGEGPTGRSGGAAEMMPEGP